MTVDRAELSPNNQRVWDEDLAPPERVELGQAAAILGSVFVIVQPRGLKARPLQEEAQ